MMLTRRDVLAIALGILIAAALVLGAYWGYPARQGAPRHGLGPEWECADVPYVDACVKRVQRPPQ
jgi:hypothetical protein